MSSDTAAFVTQSTLSLPLLSYLSFSKTERCCHRIRSFSSSPLPAAPKRFPLHPTFPTKITTTAAYSSAREERGESDDWTSARTNVNTPPSGNPQNDNDDNYQSRWRRVADCDVLLPLNAGRNPKAVILFVGGLGTGAAPQTMYGNLLMRVADAADAAIIAYRMPFVPGTDHGAVAAKAADALCDARSAVFLGDGDGGMRSVPTIGLGHSMGCKLLLLSCIEQRTRRRLHIDGNVFLAFSNANLRDAIPNSVRDAIASSPEGSRRVRDGLRFVREFINDWDIPTSPSDSTPSSAASSSARTARDSITTVLDGIAGAVDVLSSQASAMGNNEFTPSRDETLALAGTRYNVCDNALIKFVDDSIDDSEALRHVLKTRFGAQGALVWRELAGSHVTPITPDLSGGSFESVGDARWDERVREAGSGVQKEAEAVVAVVTAFVRLEIELVEKRKRQQEG